MPQTILQPHAQKVQIGLKLHNTQIDKLDQHKLHKMT